MIHKNDFHPVSRQKQILIVLGLSITLALASACTSARQMASQKSPDETSEISSSLTASSEDNISETNSEEFNSEVIEEVEEQKEEAPVRKQRFVPPPFRNTTAQEPKEEELVADNKEMVQPQPQKASAYEETPHANARVAESQSNEKLEEVLVQLVEQHETIIHLMQEQMNAQKELVNAQAAAHTATHTAPMNQTRIAKKQEFYEDEMFEKPSYAQKTVLEEEELEPYEVKVSISPDLTIVLDEELLIQWEETVSAMERGAIPRTKLPAWILQGLEWITHAPSHEPERSQILMPLYRHMKYAGHLDQVNMNSMSPADVVGIIRVFVDEMKEKKGRIRKA